MPWDHADERRDELGLKEPEAKQLSEVPSLELQESLGSVVTETELEVLQDMIWRQTWQEVLIAAYSPRAITHSLPMPEKAIT